MDAKQAAAAMLLLFGGLIYATAATCDGDPDDPHFARQLRRVSYLYKLAAVCIEWFLQL